MPKTTFVAVLLSMLGAACGAPPVAVDLSAPEAEPPAPTRVVRGKPIRATPQLAPPEKCEGATVAGEVISLSPAATPQGSEHDPLWTTARIRVDCVPSGACAASEVDVVFSASDDVLWFGAPKLAVGEQVQVSPSAAPAGTFNLAAGTPVILEAGQVDAYSCAP